MRRRDENKRKAEKKLEKQTNSRKVWRNGDWGKTQTDRCGV